jgi:hypothetical protein
MVPPPELQLAAEARLLIEHDLRESENRNRMLV